MVLPHSVPQTTCRCIIIEKCAKSAHPVVQAFEKGQICLLILILSFSFSTHVFFSYLANPPSPASSPPQLSGSRQEPYIGEGDISRHPPLNLGASSGSGPLVPLSARIIGQAAAPSGGWRRGGGAGNTVVTGQNIGTG